MIHQYPNCFRCERPVEHDRIYSPPLCDHENCASAVFHGLCLMEWREHRDGVMKRAEERLKAFERHANGECECDG